MLPAPKRGQTKSSFSSNHRRNENEGSKSRRLPGSQLVRRSPLSQQRAGPHVLVPRLSHLHPTSLLCTIHTSCPPALIVLITHTSRFLFYSLEGQAKSLTHHIASPPTVGRVSLCRSQTRKPRQQAGSSPSAPAPPPGESCSFKAG